MIANSATVTGSGSLISTNSIRIESGATYTMSANSTVSINGTTFNGPVTLVGPAGITSTGGPLPITLSSFIANRRENFIELKWTTSSELNNKGFKIERSTDARNFENIGFVEGQGSSQSTNYYSYIDIEPATTTRYYRLKQVDFDGRTEYFQTIVMKGISEQTMSRASIYPNPSQDFIYIKSNANTVYTIINSHGQILKTGSTINDMTTIAIMDLPSGIYTVQLFDGEETIAQTLVKE